MDKNSPGVGNQSWKSWASVIALLGMIAGLLFSRAVASISMMLFGIVALCNVNPLRWFGQRWWLLGLGWVGLYALSFFWTTDKEMWGEHLQVKLPFLLLPLSFAFIPPFSVTQKRVFTWGLSALMCAGACFTLSAFWRAPDAAIHSYKYAHVLPTPVYNDHIAFSAAVALSVAWIICFAPELRSRGERVGLWCIAVMLSIFLHLLAAKTGLVALYILFIGIAVQQAKKSWRAGLLMLTSTVVALAVALAVLPTFRERVGYSLVTWRSYSAGERNGIYSDADRVFSYDVACRYIMRHPLAGAGAGDVLDEMRRGYAQRYPQVPEEQVLWPHNQFLTCGMAAGIPCMILFGAWLFAPLRRMGRNRNAFYFGVMLAMLLVPLLVDPFLEVQFGVAVFLIFLLWQRKAMIDAQKETGSAS